MHRRHKRSLRSAQPVFHNGDNVTHLNHTYGVVVDESKGRKETIKVLFLAGILDVKITELKKGWI